LIYLIDRGITAVQVAISTQTRLMYWYFLFWPANS